MAFAWGSLPGMDGAAIRQSSTRPPDNELYDRGCDLVEAAAAIRRLAADPRAARAVPAALGCLESALSELRDACAAMSETVELRTDRPAWGNRALRRPAVTHPARRGFTNVERALEDAQDAAAAARSLAGRALGSRVGY